MNEQSTTASYNIRQLGRWDLIADSASYKWCATQPHLQIPKVQVTAQIASSHQDSNCPPQHKLTLNYIITLASAANIPEPLIDSATDHHPQSSTVSPWFVWLPLASDIEKNCMTADFLWQSTCLECFIAGEPITKQQIETQPYLEINVASNGQYALYHFDDYRTPDVLPPKKLTSLAAIHNYLNKRSTKLLTTQPLTTDFSMHAISNDHIVLGRQIDIDLSPLAQIWHCLTLIQPAVILQHRHSQQQLFFAPTHANPPDFHQYQLWHHIHIPL